MPMLEARRLLLAGLVLAGAALACARAEVPIQPAIGQVASPLPTPTLVPDTPKAITGELIRASATPSPVPTVPSPTPTLTLTPVPTTPSPTPTPTLSAIPADAVFTQDLTVSAEADAPLGRPADIVDGQTLTWATLRNGQGRWVFDLGTPQRVSGVRVIAQRDGNQDTTLRGVDVSTDGQNWTRVVAVTETCAAPDGTPVTGCVPVAQAVPVDIPFGPLIARYVRLAGGPTRFALAEAYVAVMP